MKKAQEVGNMWFLFDSEKKREGNTPHKWLRLLLS
jgi:hypothetical protein